VSGVAVLAVCAGSSANDVTDGAGIGSAHERVATTGSKIKWGQGELRRVRSGVKLRVCYVVSGGADGAVG
jgi:hypothetical protein